MHCCNLLENITKITKQQELTVCDLNIASMQMKYYPKVPVCASSSVYQLGGPIIRLPRRPRSQFASVQRPKSPTAKEVSEFGDLNIFGIIPVPSEKWLIFFKHPVHLLQIHFSKGVAGLSGIRPMRSYVYRARINNKEREQNVLSYCIFH